MNQDVRIRPATADDLPALGRLGGLLVRIHHGFDPQRFLQPSADVEEGYAWFLGTQLDEPDVIVLVAEAEVPGAGAVEVIGYAYAGLEPMNWKELREPAGFVHDVVVDPRARGRGIATLLVQRAAAWLEDRGAPRVLLWSAAQNTAARRIFERLGFRPTMVEMTRERAPAGSTPDGVL